MKDLLCVKIGGSAVMDQGPLTALVMDLLSIPSPRILIHGGGAEVTRVSSLLGLTAQFVDGIRMTSSEEMDVVDMVLSGKMNKYLVRRLQAAGGKAAGITGSDGGVFLGKRIHRDSRTGRIDRVDPSLLLVLMQAGYIPVLASTSMESDGSALNINADEAALAVAAALEAATLIFLSDIPGVLLDGEVAARMTKEGAEEAITRGEITGGMIPKVRSSLSALEKGVGRIVIGRYDGPGDLGALAGGMKGTTITL